MQERCLEILKRVKEPTYFPGIDGMTREQVSEFYEVDIQAIKSLDYDHKEELDADGAKIMSQDELIKRIKGNRNVFVGKIVITSSVNGQRYEIPNRGLRIYSWKAVLRIGMLLESSDMTRKVMSCLLDVKMKDIEEKHEREKQELTMKIGQAYIDGDIQKMQELSQEYRSIVQRIL